jgi:DNA repair protein RadC
MPNLERRLGQQPPLEQSKKSQEKTRPLRDLRAQFETLDKLFGVETTLLPDGTLHVLQGQIVSRISPLGELEQVDLDLKASETEGEGENLSADRQDKRIPMIEPELVVGDRFASLAFTDLSESEQDSVKRLGLEVLAARYQVGTVLTSPASVREYLQLKLRDRKAENFGAVFLDNRHRVLCFEEMFQGTIDGAQVHPRVVVQRALEANAAAVILYHNHPSGVAEPSKADENITSRLKDALSLVDVRVLDHFVVGAEDVTSFTERGLL